MTWLEVALASSADVDGPGWLDAHRDDALTIELQRELAIGHDLYGVEWTVIARWGPSDDVLVTFDGDQAAIVHLTWSRSAPERAG